MVTAKQSVPPQFALASQVREQVRRSGGYGLSERVAARDDQSMICFCWTTFYQFEVVNMSFFCLFFFDVRELEQPFCIDGVVVRNDIGNLNMVKSASASDPKLEQTNGICQLTCSNRQKIMTAFGVGRVVVTHVRLCGCFMFLFAHFAHQTIMTRVRFVWQGFPVRWMKTVP